MQHYTPRDCFSAEFLLCMARARSLERLCDGRPSPLCRGRPAGLGGGGGALDGELGSSSAVEERDVRSAGLRGPTQGSHHEKQPQKGSRRHGHVVGPVSSSSRQSALSPPRASTTSPPPSSRIRSERIGDTWGLCAADTRRPDPVSGRELANPKQAEMHNAMHNGGRWYVWRVAPPARCRCCCWHNRYEVLRLVAMWQGSRETVGQRAL
ncbi:hypothetical protein N658DRAFT_290069 [Parathielavia hyrcaniae]|uniref:Uncharacterized protein n=1 Tax=Parathielavia hyrcaniae TaxID=113614 RepID=A0AAN6PWR2_9PEZI|nr:hypothetical protein N658DRAFT_290069 [Parathielavia hyrcaniae]